MAQSNDEFSKVGAFTSSLIGKLQRHPKRIVFTDGEDERVLRVAAEMVRLEVGVPILLGDVATIRTMAEAAEIDLTFVKVLNPAEASDLDLFCSYLSKIERYRGVELANACEVVEQPHYFAAMMIQYGQADGLVGGNTSLPSSVFRPLRRVVKPVPKVPRIFSVAVLEAPHLAHFGSEGLLFLADCGMNAELTVEQLAAMAVETGHLARIYFGRRPRVAFLSHSTHGSSPTPATQSLQAATELARQGVDSNEIEIDGELQADVALDPTAAEIKLPNAAHKKPADVLIFPNLDAAHISLKLLRHVGGAQVFGPLVMGLSRPAAQVARTVTPASLLGTAMAVGVEAIKYHELYPDGEVASE